MILQNLQNYSQQTTLHGWQYFQSENGWLRKFIWFLVIVFHNALAIYFIWVNCNEYLEAKTITTINSTTSSLNNVMFPSVYICNLNQVTKSFLKEMEIQEHQLNHQHFIISEFIFGSPENHEHTGYKQRLLEVQMKITELYQKYGYQNDTLIFRLSQQKCKDMLLKVKWSDRPLKYFAKVFTESTEYGICCVINPYLEFEASIDKDVSWQRIKEEYLMTIPKGYASNGLQSGLMATIDLEIFNHALRWDSTGFKIGLSHPHSKMIMRNSGFNAPPGFLTEVALMPTLTMTNPKVTSRFSHEDRDCYVENEFELKYLKPDYGFHYSMSNCLYNSLYQKIIEECKCIFHLDYKFVKSQNPNLERCLGSKQLHCANKLLNKMGNEQEDMKKSLDVNGIIKPCFQSCNLQENNFILSQLVYPHTSLFKHHQDLCLIMEKINKICNDDSKKEIFESYYQHENITCKELSAFHLEQNESCQGGIEGGHVRAHKEYIRLIEFYHNYAKENIAKVTIFIRDPYCTSYIKNEKIPLIDFISNTGGLVGLCLGLSFISAIELIYHCVNCIFKKD